MPLDHRRQGVAFALCAGVLLLLSALTAEAQVIVGAVTDSATSSPLASVRIVIESDSGKTIGETRTRDDGSFLLDGERADSLRFAVYKIGSLPSYTPFYVIAEEVDTLRVDIEAPLVGVMLATVSVVSKSRRFNFNRKQLESARADGWPIVEPHRVAKAREQSSSLEELLRRAALSGVRAPSGRGECFTSTRSRRCLVIAVDGVLLDPYAHISPQDVYFVAYIMPVKAQQIYGPRAREGVLFVATRRQGDNERPPNDRN